MSKITDQMIEAARAKGRELAGKQPGALVEAMGEIAAEGAKAAFAAVEAQGEVKVKPMEWVFSPDGSYRHCAETITGIYWISQNGPDEFYLERDITSIGGWRKSLDEAKAAAQADYERRILSAISEEP